MHSIKQTAVKNLQDAKVEKVWGAVPGADGHETLMSMGSDGEVSGYLDYMREAGGASPVFVVEISKV